MSQSSQNNSGVIVAGLALFSMFFGAGDLIWPLILGGNVGTQNLFGTLGLLITGVSLPLLGLIAMLLFQGDYHAFFGRIGKIPSLCLIFIVQIILGPIGSIPRNMTLSFSTLKPYLSEDLTLFYFSLLVSVLLLAFTIRPQKIVSILGVILTPLLLTCLCAILGTGFYHHPMPQELPITNSEAFFKGLNVGYNTLDLIASFIFAPLVLSHFTTENGITPENRKQVFKKMVKASLLAAGLLSFMYIGLTYIASYYTPFLQAHQPEERLSAIALYLLGPYGAFIACLSVSMACLTTAIPLVSIFADYIRKDFTPNQMSSFIPLCLTLVISIFLSNFGFMGIANLLGPVLQILCPGLIVLSCLNILHKLKGTPVYRAPIYATFALSFYINREMFYSLF